MQSARMAIFKLRGARWQPVTAAALVALLAWGCGGPSPVGVYTDASGATRYEFRPDGRVFISVLGATVTGAYETDRDRILISAPQGTVVLVRKDGRLQGPMGLELLPQPDHPPVRDDIRGDNRR
jgi:hypothetical protein